MYYPFSQGNSENWLPAAGDQKKKKRNKTEAGV